METNHLPKVSFDAPETGCCPRFNPEPWDGQTFVFENKLFVKGTTLNFLHMPLTMGRMIGKTWKQITDAGADSKDEFVLLSYDLSPWKGEHYFSVEKEVPGAEMVRLSGTYLTKVFEGPYRDAKKWVHEMDEYVKSQGKETQKLYFYYTTCPKCYKHYGKNYIVAFAQVA